MDVDKYGSSVQHLKLNPVFLNTGLEKCFLHFKENSSRVLVRTSLSGEIHWLAF